MKTKTLIIGTGFLSDNLIKKISKTKCETFRVQFFFHGCIIKGPTNIILKKNNIFYYHLGSIKDYLDLKEFKIKLF